MQSDSSKISVSVPILLVVIAFAASAAAQTNPQSATVARTDAASPDELLAPGATILRRWEIDVDADGQMDQVLLAQPPHCPSETPPRELVVAYRSGSRWSARTIAGEDERPYGAFLANASFLVLRGTPIAVVEYSITDPDTEASPRYAFFRVAQSGAPEPLVEVSSSAGWNVRPETSSDALVVQDDRQIRRFEWTGTSIREVRMRGGRGRQRSAPTGSAVASGVTTIALPEADPPRPRVISGPAEICSSGSCPSVETTRQLPGGTSTVVGSISLAAGGDAYVVGTYSQPMDLGDHLAASGPHQAFIARFARDGAPRWSRRLVGQLGASGTAVVTQPGDDVCAAGGYEGTGEFGGRPLANAGASDAFIACFSPTGELRWARHVGGAGRDGVGQLLSDSAGDLALATTGEQPAIQWISPTGEIGARHDLQPTVAYSQSPIAMDRDGNVFVVGTAESADAGRPADERGSELIVSLGRDGTRRWAMRGRGRCGVYAQQVIGAPAGVFLLGEVEGEAFVADVRVSAAERSPFVAAVDTDGGVRWVHVLPAAGSVQALVGDQAGNLALLSEHPGGVDLGGGSVGGLPREGHGVRGYLSIWNADGSHRASKTLWDAGADMAVFAATYGGDSLWALGSYLQPVSIAGRTFAPTTRSEDAGREQFLFRVEIAAPPTP